MSCMDDLDVGLPCQTKDGFSYAVVVVDRIGGWEEGNEREDQMGASMCIYTNAVVCNGQRHMENFMMNKLSSITEAVNGAWESLSEDHEWIPRSSIKLQECKVFLESFAL